MTSKFKIGEILFFVFVFFSLQNISLNAQILNNLDFEQQCDSSKTSLCFWNLSWLLNAKVAHTEIVKNGALLIEGENETSIGFVEQTAIIDTSSNLRLVTFSGKIKTENVVGNGAGLSLTLLDKYGNYLFSQYMGNNILSAISGTSSWTEYKLKAVCSPNTYRINIGGILNGNGQAWFDDFEVLIESVEDRKPNEMAKKYLSQACEIIEKHSLMRDSIDLQTLKETALNIAGPAKNYAECHLAVQYLITSLGDHHSFFMDSERVKQWQGGDNGSSTEQKIKFAKHKIIEGLGFISVPGFHSNDTNLKIKFADSLQYALKLLEDSKIKGWIIDLRENDGGNMNPMLAGLGPLFDAETLGYLVDVEGNKEAWGYKNGAPFSGDEIEESASFPIKLQNQNLPIAVLFGSGTGSSGEIIVISFTNNKNTKSFGQPTWGISTGNGEFDLLDGSKMFLTSTVMADRTGKTYGGKINPDMMVGESDNEEDATLSEAIKWLKKQTD